jgi:hypothetical protein
MNISQKATKAAQAAIALAIASASLLGLTGTAQAAFQGRDTSGAASTTCTVSGPGKCTYFYDTTLGITILNNWNIGRGAWDGSASPAANSAQGKAASFGFAASGLSGWVLPTGDGGAPAGAQNQYKSIFNSAGGTFTTLSGQFDGVQADNYWSGTLFAPIPGMPWLFFAANGAQNFNLQNLQLFAVAVRPGDVAAPVPEPETYAMMLLGLGALMVAVRRRPR